MKKGDKVSISPRFLMMEMVASYLDGIKEIDFVVDAIEHGENVKLYFLKGIDDFAFREKDLILENLNVKKKNIKECNKVVQELEAIEEIVKFASSVQEGKYYGHFEYVNPGDCLPKNVEKRVIIDNKYTGELLNVIKELKVKLEEKLESL